MENKNSPFVLRWTTWRWVNNYRIIWQWTIHSTALNLANSFIHPSADNSTNASTTVTPQTQQSESSTVQSTADTKDPGNTSDSRTTTQLIISQQTTHMNVTNNTQTTTSQSTWSQTSELTMSDMKITTVNSSETRFPAEPNSTAGTRFNKYLDCHNGRPMD